MQSRAPRPYNLSSLDNLTLPEELQVSPGRDLTYWDPNESLVKVKGEAISYLPSEATVPTTTAVVVCLVFFSIPLVFPATIPTWLVFYFSCLPAYAHM